LTSSFAVDWAALDVAFEAESGSTGALNANTATSR
jgi:hypothetical protein